MDTIDRNARHKSRGSLTNRSGRFEATTRHGFDDGWDLPEDIPPFRTTVLEDATKSIVAHNDSPDVPFDQSINPYRGCEHGCIYCFARPSHAFLGLSPGLDFETQLFRKTNAAALLEDYLRDPKYRCRVLALGSNTDPYQPIERRYRVTREVLEVMSAFNQPVGIVTKSALVTRDIDILAPMAAKGLVRVCVSLTTLDKTLQHRMEPRAGVPAARLAAMRTLSEAGIPVGVMASPMIPALNDSELESILGAARKAGASTASYILLRLPLEIEGLFQEWLCEHYPNRAARVMSLIRQMRGGKAYRSKFGERMRGTGEYADLLRHRFRLACTRLGLDETHGSLATDLFLPPVRKGDQLALF